jgi:hypothetical protein
LTFSSKPIVKVVRGVAGHDNQVNACAFQTVRFRKHHGQGIGRILVKDVSSSVGRGRAAADEHVNVVGIACCGGVSVEQFAKIYG